MLGTGYQPDLQAGFKMIELELSRSAAGGPAGGIDQPAPQHAIGAYDDGTTSIELKASEARESACAQIQVASEGLRRKRALSGVQSL